MPLAREPAYIGQLLRQRGRIAKSGDRRRLFLHLGHWDATAPTRGTALELEWAAQERLNDRILELAALTNNQAILDAGCGIGGTLAAVNERFDGMSLTGLNIGKRQLAIAKAEVRPRGCNRLDWVLADACGMPFENKAFDRILAIECAQHFPSRRRFLSEAARTLRSGGRLVISDFVATPQLKNKRDRDSSIRKSASRIARTMGPWPDFWGDEGNYAAMARDSGLRLERAEDATKPILPSFERIVHPTEGAATLLGLFLRSGLLRMMHLSFLREPSS